MKGIILKIFIFISTIILARFSGPGCKHAEYQKKVQVTRLKLGGDQTRFLESTPWESIRIYVDYTKLESQISVDVTESVKPSLVIFKITSFDIDFTKIINLTFNHF